jgi:putative peptide zinc metalloprotease protein
MSMAIDRAPGAALLRDPRPTASELATWPRLLEGTELIGQASGSGLREPPYLVGRCDGQVVQLSQLLYVIASCMDGRELASIADSAGARLDLRITPEQVAYVAEHKLFPLGLVAHRDGSVPKLERLNALLALKFRAGIVPERVVNTLAEVLRALFWPPVVIATVTALLACDVWLGTSHGIGAGLKAGIRSPALGLALLALTILSAAFHECGHAAACRYGGARPGRIGVGIYLIWPVFYNDTTDSYRLSKAGRLRTDLGGIYFNALFALAAAGAYFATAYAPLVIIVVTQQIMMLNQFIPWMRLDGYHIVSDLIGVSDLFARIKPVIASLLPGRHPGPRVTELKPWARAAVTTWVLTTVAALAGLAALIVVNAPGYLTRAWQSLIFQLDWVGYGARIGGVVDVLSGAIAIVALLLPVAGITLTYLLLCRGIGIRLALRRARIDLTVATANGEKNPPARSYRASSGRAPTTLPDSTREVLRGLRQADQGARPGIDRAAGLRLVWSGRSVAPEVGGPENGRMKADDRAEVGGPCATGRWGNARRARRVERFRAMSP